MDIRQSLLTLAACASLGACATATPEARVALAAAPSKITTGVTVDAPAGFREMCSETPDLCADAPVRVEHVSFQGLPEAASRSDFQAGLLRASFSVSRVEPVMTALATTEGALSDEQAIKLLNKINRQVNREVDQVSDWNSVGASERWSRPTTTRYGTLQGDCEDIAIEKRLRLIEAGFPEQDLFYAVVYRSDVGLHAVLVARTQKGDMVLDSRSAWVQLWSKVPYTWVKTQTPGAQMAWSMVVPATAKPTAPTNTYAVASLSLEPTASLNP